MTITAEPRGIATIVGWNRDGERIELVTLKNTTVRQALGQCLTFLDDDIVDTDFDFQPFPRAS